MTPSTTFEMLADLDKRLMNHITDLVHLRVDLNEKIATLEAKRTPHPEEEIGDRLSEEITGEEFLDAVEVINTVLARGTAH